jgi:hypothetical protein
VPTDGCTQKPRHGRQKFPGPEHFGRETAAAATAPLFWPVEPVMAPSAHRVLKARIDLENLKSGNWLVGMVEMGLQMGLQAKNELSSVLPLPIKKAGAPTPTQD